MALEDQVGLEGPVYEADMERGKIREFARAMGAPLDEFCAGPNPLVPPTFLVSVPYTWGYTIERPRGTAFKNIDHDLSVSLHAEETFIFHGTPPRAGDRLLVKSILSDIRRKSGKSGGQLVFLETTTTYSSPAGKLRAEQKTTSVTTEKVPGQSEGVANLPEYDPVYNELERPSAFAEITRTDFAALSVGKGPGEITTPALMIQDIVRFQSVVGEDDPLHYDSKWAAKQGYPSIFALGMHQASQMAAYASHWLPPENLRKFRIRFSNMSWPGDRFVFNGTVENLDQERAALDIHLTCKRKQGVLINEAWAHYDFGQKGV